MRGRIARRGVGTVTTFVLVVILILLLLGTSLAFQTRGLRTDSRIVIYRLLASNGARNAIQELVPAFMRRVNRCAMHVVLPAGRMPLSGAAVALPSDGGDEEAYQRFLAAFDRGPRYEMESLRESLPPVTFGPEGPEMDVPADPFYTAFRDDPAGFKGEMPVVLSQRIYAPFGDRAHFSPFRIQVLTALESQFVPESYAGVLAFESECAMSAEHAVVRRTLQVRYTYHLAAPVPGQKLRPLSMGQVPLGECLLASHEESR